MHVASTGAKPAGACALVIFGARGDLTKRLVVPALYNLACANLLPPQFAITGVDLADISSEKWHESLKEMTQNFVQGGGHPEAFKQEVWDWLVSRMYYLRGDLNDAETYRKLAEHLQNLDGKCQTCGNYLFYLAIADRFFAPVVQHLGESKLAQETNGKWRRVVIEKPFGHDLESAIDLDQKILHFLKESQIYRIDHFLGKETVQNIMMFRFANGFFEPVWNRDRIDHVQITVAETVGVENRGKFYEKTGALRDMVPNHLFQLLAMTAMEAPSSFRADAVRSEKAKIIESVQLCSVQDVNCIAVRGQYGPGAIEGNPVKGYREEPDVDPNSNVETFVALKLLIENWRWAGVPFYVRTGKRLARRKSVIAIRFKEAPHALFRETAVSKPAPNWLIIRVQPEEGISLEFGAKVPGPTMKLGEVWMDFKYRDYFGAAPSTGYETLIYDVMIGDATLFQRADNIEAGWRVVQPVLDAWASEKRNDFPNYSAGSQGPAAADELLERDGRHWRPIT